MPLPGNLTFYLEPTATLIGRWIDLLITVLVLLSSVIFVVETYPLPHHVKETLDAVNTGILIIFAIEYTIRLWRVERKLQYIFSLYSIIDLIAILPFFLVAVDISYIRIFRWFRILKIIRFIETQIWLGNNNTKDRLLIVRILFTLFSIIFVYSGVIYQVEHRVNPEEFRTFLDAVYFSVVTMTTVGFGDVTPTSQMGRLMTVLMILTGIALIPSQIGALIKQLVKNSNQVEARCTVCGLSLHDENAKFCKICGSRLEINQNPG